MLKHMFMPYRRYFDFRGRSSRAEYWSFFLLMAGIIALTALLYAQAGAFEPGFDPETSDPGFGWTLGTAIFGIFFLVSGIPAIALEVRRWHDIGKSGWYWWIRFIPLVGTIIVLVFMAMKGNAGGNRYGPDPLPGGDARTFE